MTVELRRNALVMLLALVPAFFISLLSLLFVMFEWRIGSYVEALWQSFVFVNLGIYLYRFFQVYKGKSRLLEAKKNLERAAFLILAVQFYLGFYGIKHLFEDQCVMDAVFFGVQFYGFALVGGMIWFIRKVTLNLG